MDWIFLLLLGLVLFLARDVLLLGYLTSRGGSRAPVVAYAVVLLAVFVALGAAADFISHDQALALLRDARLWIPAVLIHVLLGFGFTRARRLTHSRPWVLFLTLAPAPVFLYSAGGLCWWTLAQLSSLKGAATGAVLGALWIATVIPCAWWMSRRRESPARPNGALNFAAAANLSAILLLPLHQQSSQSSLAQSSYHWEAALPALAATAAMIGAAFLFHRLRRTP